MAEGQKAKAKGIVAQQHSWGKGPVLSKQMGESQKSSLLIIIEVVKFSR